MALRNHPLDGNNGRNLTESAQNMVKNSGTRRKKTFPPIHMIANRFQKNRKVGLKGTNTDRKNSVILKVKHTFWQQIEHSNVTKSAAIKVISTKTTSVVDHLIAMRRASRTGTEIITRKLEKDLN